MIETNNMYHGAYYLTEGFSICNVEKRNDSRLGDTVVFSFNGVAPDAEEAIKHKFELGTAMCNIRSYLTALVTIRDILHNTMRSSTQTSGAVFTRKSKGTKNEQRRTHRDTVRS